MPVVIPIRIHASQFPGQVHRDLLQSLRRRCLDHKFHYDGVEQAREWLALHQACSPARTDLDCRAIYQESYAVLANLTRSRRVHLISLGCGGGQKESAFIKVLHDTGHRVIYTPCDVSLPLVIAACQEAASSVGLQDCHPLVGDLLRMSDLADLLDQPFIAHASRLMTLFGMLPNLAPKTLLARVMPALRSRDWLLCSANLVPGPDFDLSMERILHQYDNPLTRQWLLTSLQKLGFHQTDGQLQFVVEKNFPGRPARRIAAFFVFRRACTVMLGPDQVSFRRGERLQLFYSLRYAARQMLPLLARNGLDVVDSWISRAGDEGIYLCRRH
ncbi:MAG: L-histidine N(alpha)-methyltransferase [Candidatus Omnitrophica bacterium]|nr:L-histidine N(alpha)-methyltransferase [Candidatus Omnitrophota bacterium]